jgi:hypothetical protein
MPCFDDYRLRTRPMTADDVLAVLVHYSRLNPEAEFSEALPTPTLDLSIHDWQLTYELNGWQSLDESLDELFGISLGHDVYRTFVRSARQRKLGELCELIAGRARVPVAEPITLFGDTSLAAGVFLTVRCLFAQSGADVSELRPSSALSPYLSRHVEKIVPALVRLAPGRLPSLRVDEPAGLVYALGFVAAQILYWTAKLLGNGRLTLVGALNILLFTMLGYVGHRLVRPTVRLAYAPTFADLCRVIAGERPVHGPAFPVVLRPTSPT